MRLSILLAPLALIGMIAGGTAKTPRRVQVSAEEQSWSLIHKVNPVCPALGSQVRIHGTVRFTATIDIEGHVMSLKVIGGHPLLVQAAMDAVEQWLYKPTLLNEQPVEVVTLISVYVDCATQQKSRPRDSAAAIRLSGNGNGGHLA